MAVLYVVSTPIGNVGDITIRALDILKNGEVVLFAENPANTVKLLSKLGVKRSVYKLNQFSDLKKNANLVDVLMSDQDMAYVTDAGTPAVSDPGYELVGYVRENFPNMRIEVVPGASALTAAIAVAGVDVRPFVFWGFLPTKKGRKTIIDKICEDFEKNNIVFESKYRVVKLLRDVMERRDDVGVIVCKELTKINERVFVGSVGEVLHEIEAGGEELLRGEFVVIFLTRG